MRKQTRRIGPVEQLEPRFLLSGSSHSTSLDYHPLVAAGDPNGVPADSPNLRIDPNTTTSPFAGVGSLVMVTKKGSGSCTATPIGDRFVLTAAHCVDLNDDGRSTKQDGLLSVTFNLNYGSDLSHQIPVSASQTHPDYTGFNRPSVNDDLAILTLSSPLPAGVPIYGIYTGSLDRTIVLVGYGRSGDGVTGYYVDASDTVKRRGENYPDSLGGQDDYGRANVVEVFTYDFDGPTGNGTLGGATLGNTREGMAGPGDSGGPSFVLISSDPTAASSYAIAGVNTFTIDNGSIAAPRFSSMAGGIIIKGYESWVQSLLAGKKFNTGGLSGGGGGRGGLLRSAPFYHTPAADWQSVHTESQQLTISAVRPSASDDELNLANGTGTEFDSNALINAASAQERSLETARGGGRQHDDYVALHDLVLANWSSQDTLGNSLIDAV